MFLFFFCPPWRGSCHHLPSNPPPAPLSPLGPLGYLPLFPSNLSIPSSTLPVFSISFLSFSPPANLNVCPLPLLLSSLFYHFSFLSSLILFFSFILPTSSFSYKIPYDSCWPTPCLFCIHSHHFFLSLHHTWYEIKITYYKLTINKWNKH